MPDQIHYDLSMGPANLLQTVTTTTALVAAALSANPVTSYSVLARQVDNTLDPGATPVTNACYLLEDISNLHTNFTPAPSGVGDDDIVRWDGAAWVIKFNASSRGAGSTCSIIAENRIDYFTGSIWQDLYEFLGIQAAIDTAVTGLWDDRGNYDASVNTFPASGGSGTAGAVLKGDIWTISVAGTLGGVDVAISQTVRALVDTPAQTSTNWAIGLANTDIDDSITDGVTARAPSQNAVFDALALKEDAIGFTPEDSANKNASGGYAGLSALKIMFKNVADTFTSFFTNTNTAARTYTFQDRDGTIADDTDLGLKETAANKNASGGYVGLSSLKIMFKNAADTFTSFFTNTNTAARTYTFQDRDGIISDDTDLALKAPLASPEFTGSIEVSGAQDEQLKLEVTDGATAPIFIGYYDTAGVKGYLGYGTSDDALHINNNRSNSISLYTSNSKKFELDTTGNVFLSQGGLSIKSYTTGTLPDATTNNGVILHDSTLNKLVRSNGTTYDTM